ncbi:MAG: hypothetical protein Q9187_004423 [Circinaria calcarea]
MKGKRSKQYRKLMQTYGLTFGFREPYQVLVDAQMIQDTERFKMDLAASLQRTLQGQIKPMITQCSIRHLYALPASIPAPQKTAFIENAKTFERRRCNHHVLDEPLSTLDCYKDIIDPKGSSTNKNRYVVASQDEDVRRWCRGIRGVPSVYVKRSVMVMEPMADVSKSAKEGMERGKLREGLKTTGVKRKREPEEGQGAEHDWDGKEPPGEEVEKKKRKVKGPKGPNPLSVKTPKKSASVGDLSVAKKHEVKGDSDMSLPVEGVVDIAKNAPEKKKRKRKHKPSQSTKALPNGPEGHDSES